MASSTKNVKLGVCRISWGGYDLGLTIGGVEATVKTETHKTNVDQFGKTVVKEAITSRDVSVKVPLAETTVENMVAIMPGATMTSVGGAVASGTVTVTTNPTDGDTVLINGVTFTFKTVPALPEDVLIGANAAATAANLQANLAASTLTKVALAQYSVAGAVVTVKFGNLAIYGTTGAKGVEGNTFTIATGTAGAKVTVSGATLAGGLEPTSKSVDVSVGTSIDLLKIAKELRLHPVNLDENDRSEDFVIPLAATPGALTFAYKVEDERVYNVEFQGYPDDTGKLFYVGR